MAIDKVRSMTLEDVLKHGLTGTIYRTILFQNGLETIVDGEACKFSLDAKAMEEHRRSLENFEVSDGAGKMIARIMHPQIVGDAIIGEIKIGG